MLHWTDYREENVRCGCNQGLGHYLSLFKPLLLFRVSHTLFSAWNVSLFSVIHSELVSTRLCVAPTVSQCIRNNFVCLDPYTHHTHSALKWDEPWYRVLRRNHSSPSYCKVEIATFIRSWVARTLERRCSWRISWHDFSDVSSLIRHWSRFVNVLKHFC